MIITKNIEVQIQEEINRAVNLHIGNIDESCSDDIFIYKVSKIGLIWTVRCCSVCGRPNLVHQDPWGGRCTQEPINQDLKAEYIEQAEEHRRIKKVAEILAPTGRTREQRTRRTPSISKNQDGFRTYATWEQTEYSKNTEDKYEDDPITVFRKVPMEEQLWNFEDSAETLKMTTNKDERKKLHMLFNWRYTITFDSYG